MANLDSIDLSISKGTLNEIDGSILDGQDVISTERLHKNDTLMGTYKVLSGPIKGGMGSVWCVRHLEDGNIMAMKRPQPKYFAEGSARRKEVFIRECESWIRLALHPNVVACFYVRDISGVPSIFSEWMDGGSLRDRIADGTLYSGTDKEKQARLLSIAIQTARGLLYAHQKGLVHRDMKPDNILLTKEFDAKVADFGLSVAKSALTSSADDPAAGTTPAGSPTLSEADIITMLTGKRPADTTPRKASGGYTRAYCSPEQLRGEVLTAATDIYSWAASMAEMYIGKKIWEKGEDAGSAFRNYSDAPCAAFPDGLRELLVRCMSDQAADRPADFSEIERTLLAMYRNTFGHGYEGEEEKAAPNSSDSLNNQAVSYMEIGLADKAEECWEEISRLDPSHPETLYNRALVNWRSGQVTGRKAANSLMSHPFFRESEEGKSRIAAMESEAGMTSFDEPLFESRDLVSARETRPIRAIGDWQFCHGKLYILLSYLPEGMPQQVCRFPQASPAISADPCHRSGMVGHRLLFIQDGTADVGESGEFPLFCRGRTFRWSAWSARRHRGQSGDGRVRQQRHPSSFREEIAVFRSGRRTQRNVLEHRHGNLAWNCSIFGRDGCCADAVLLHEHLSDNAQFDGWHCRGSDARAEHRKPRWIHFRAVVFHRQLADRRTGAQLPHHFKVADGNGGGICRGCRPEFRAFSMVPCHRATAAVARTIAQYLS